MATRGDLGLFFGVCGFLLGGIGCYLGFRADDRSQLATEINRDDAEMFESLGGQVRELRDDLSASNLRITALKDEVEAARRAADALAKRVASLEASAPK